MKYFIVIINLFLVGGLSYIIFFNEELLLVNKAILSSILFTTLVVSDLLAWAISSGRLKWKRRNDNGLERRSCFRVVYTPKKRPWLKVANERFQVADISQRGLRFINDRNIDLDRTIRGTITFSDGEAVTITGNIEWKKADGISLLLEDLIPHTTISKEHSHTLSH
jgi:hypothetical protein